MTENEGFEPITPDMEDVAIVPDRFILATPASQLANPLNSGDIVKTPNDGHFEIVEDRGPDLYLVKRAEPKDDAVQLSSYALQHAQ